MNLIPAVESIYRKEGKVETAAEVLAVIRTTSGAGERFEAQLKELHPYDVPEIVGYARWVEESVAYIQRGPQTSNSG